MANLVERETENKPALIIVNVGGIQTLAEGWSQA